MSYLPAGCTNEMIDRATADEDREKCQTCDGAGEVVSNEVVFQQCPDCHGTGYEPRADTREDDAYDQSVEDADSDMDY